MYIFNLTLACWLTEFDDGKKPCGDYFTPGEGEQTLKKLVKYWNSKKKQYWSTIHYPCRVEHFEVYEKLPKGWNKVCHMS